MCRECNYKHQWGYHCPCECHMPIDRNIVERDSQLLNKESQNE